MISVVVPTYNDAHFLPTALASCLAQTIPVEIVLVDDGSSTPWPPEVQQFIAQHRDIVTCVRHAWNCGLSAARNTGIAHARFELIVPLDADDWFLPGTLAPLVSALTEDVDIVYGNVLDSGQLYEPVKRPLQRSDFLEDTPLFCSSLFRRRVWQMAGGYTVRIGPHYEDWNFWAKAFKAGCRFHYVPITVYEHRSRPDSMLRFLHDDRPRFVRVATEPLWEPEPPAPQAMRLEMSVQASAEPPHTGGEQPAAVTAVAVVDAIAAPDAGAVEVGTEARANAAGGTATAPPTDSVTQTTGASALDVESMPASDAAPDMRAALRLAHARMGQLMIEVERARVRPPSAAEPRRSAALVQAHARIGQLMVELQRTKAPAPDATGGRPAPALVAAHAVIGRLLLQGKRTDDAPPVDGGA